MNREKKIVTTSIYGILVNIVLVGFKLAVGFLANSIAVIMDAVNNFSDALSSGITIVGTKLAGKKPDKKHPYGYGRIEYLTSVIIAVLVLIAGVTAFRESLEKIITPSETNYTALSFVVISVAVVVKFAFGFYVKKVGKSVNSQALVASGSDAFLDGILSFTTLVGAVIALIWGVNIEGYLGVLIAVIILKAGLGILIETLNSIIGTRPEKELAEKIKEKVNSYDKVNGAYDLALHSYGPNSVIGSIHIEVDEGTTAQELHKLSRLIAAEVYAEFGVILTVGVYASQDLGIATALKADLEKILGEFPEILGMHGFYVDESEKTVIFDIVVDFKADAQAVHDTIVQRISKLYPDYTFAVVLDSDYSD